ncbi:hypothetical protein RHSIM_Rhsim12G0137300 [Rhododendron simsii]|uniref:Uncharacterized protein n=1 Tax=Rhododendron simsii TaxID=118357 RepID=A0A834G426_RHOSS|nr:hypothetical protein RHSIM_Rhsim12G0137300 [Rhododendron simsii]
MTGELLLRVSQSTILLPPQPHHFRHHASTNRTYALPLTNRSSPPSICANRLQHQLLLKCTATTTEASVDYSGYSKPDIEIEPDTGGSGGGVGGGAGGEGGGGRGGGGDSKDSNESSEGGSEESDNSKKMGGMSMSQKLTLAYAALVGGNNCLRFLGGVMGYLKSGSQKSLGAGGLSALLLLFIYSELPTRPAFASSLGFGISAALLVVMGSRFKKSGKIFPAGVVSFVSLVMSSGYLHGILRSWH